MTSLIRGFDQSLRDDHHVARAENDLRPAIRRDQLFLRRVVPRSRCGGPNLTVDDGEAIKRLATTVALVDTWLGAGGQPTVERVFYRNERTALGAHHGHERALRRRELRDDHRRPRASPSRKCTHRRNVAVIGHGPYEALFEKKGMDPIGKKVRIGAVEYTVVGVIGKRPGTRIRAELGRLRHHPLHDLAPPVRIRARPHRPDGRDEAP